MAPRLWPSERVRQPYYLVLATVGSHTRLHFAACLIQMRRLRDVGPPASP